MADDEGVFEKTGEFAREVMRCAAEGMVHDGTVYIPTVELEITFSDRAASVFSLNFRKRGVKLAQIKNIHVPDSGGVAGSRSLSLSDVGVSFLLHSTQKLKVDSLAALPMTLYHVSDNIELHDHGDDMVTLRGGPNRVRMNYDQVEELVEACGLLLKARENRAAMNNGPEIKL